MKMRKNGLMITLLCLFICILIFDAKTTFQGAQEGITLCISVVIPSLFPFLFLSAMLSGMLMGKRIKSGNFMCRLCGIPAGAESLFFLSFLCGYPVGAKMIAQAYDQGCISKSAASRMLGFCNNAGPAFIFGMIAGLFTNRIAAWVVWFIHILTAFLTGILLPNKTNEACVLSSKEIYTIANAMEICLKSMGNICGWVIIFRVILSVLNRFLCVLPIGIKAAVIGFLELTNGISYLDQVRNPGLRFLLCSAMLSFGGFCVLMQTFSITKHLSFRYYFPGKVIQCILSSLLSMLLWNVLFSTLNICNIQSLFLILLSFGIGLFIFLILCKKSSSISRPDVV